MTTVANILLREFLASAMLYYNIIRSTRIRITRFSFGGVISDVGGRKVKSDDVLCG